MKNSNKREPVIWGLEHWWEKAAYIVGAVVSIVWIVAFVIGFVIGIAS